MINLLFALSGIFLTSLGQATTNMSAPMAQNCSSQLIRGTSELENHLINILGTQNRSFRPKAAYKRKFARAIRRFQPVVGGFEKALMFFKDVRIQIAETNPEDSDLLAFLLSKGSMDHYLGKSKDMTNVTSIYPYFGNYAELGTRYRDLYDKMLAQLDRGEFTVGADNEITRRYARQAKKEFQITADRVWWINYETLNGSPNPILVSGSVAVNSLGEKIFGIYNTFSRDVPSIVRHLKDLWNKILLTEDKLEALSLIAEFEWFFFHSNPIGRAAASIGDVMSLSLQIEKGIPLRSQFVHLDFEALTRDRLSYIQWRTTGFHPNP